LGFGNCSAFEVVPWEQVYGLHRFASFHPWSRAPDSAWPEHGRAVADF